MLHYIIFCLFQSFKKNHDMTVKDELSQWYVNVVFVIKTNPKEVSKFIFKFSVTFKLPNRILYNYNH